jgi:hypothetical protein
MVTAGPLWNGGLGVFLLLPPRIECSGEHLHDRMLGSGEQGCSASSSSSTHISLIYAETESLATDNSDMY